MTSVIGDILVVNKINANALTSAKFNHVCRCCLSDGQTMFPIFKLDFKGTSFTELLKRCLSLKIEKNDTLPQNVCAICVKKVVELHSFKEQCSTSENILKDVLHAEFSQYQTINFLNKIIVPKEEIKDEYFENPTPIYTCEIDNIAGINEIKEEVIASIGQDCTEFEQNVDDIVVKNATRKKQKKPRITPKLPFNMPRKKSQHFKLTCRVCKAVFESKKDFRKHRIKEKHPLKENRLCKVCGTVVVFGKAKEHMQMHKVLKMYECDICFKRFGFVHNLKRHKMIHTNERPYKCQMCEKAFIEKVNLEDHISTHTGEKRYVCHQCGKAFIYKQSFKSHLRYVHAPESADGKKVKKKRSAAEISTKVQCDICQKVCSSKVAWRMHQLSHNERKFICSHCGKGFYSPSALQIHIRVHTGEKPYQCTTCQKSFAGATNLRSHILIHTREKPFVCKVCCKAFTQSSHLKYHMRTHSGERPHMCSYCGKSFSLKGTLTVHVRTHTGETPYVCDVCDKGFYNAGSLKKHRQSHCVYD